MLVLHGQRDTRLTPKAIWNLRERQETGPRVSGIGVSTLSTIETGQSPECTRAGLHVGGRRPRRSHPRPLGRRKTRGAAITRDRRLVVSHFLVDSTKPERLRCAVGGIGTIANQPARQTGQDAQRHQVEAVVLQHGLQSPGVAISKIRHIATWNFSTGHVANTAETKHRPLETDQPRLIPSPKVATGV